MRPHWEPTIQLLRYEDGEETLRFCYYHGARFGRGPMIVSGEDLKELKAHGAGLRAGDFSASRGSRRGIRDKSGISQRDPGVIPGPLLISKLLLTVSGFSILGI